jgi:hypothetical protein
MSDMTAENPIKETELLLDRLFLPLEESKAALPSLEVMQLLGKTFALESIVEYVPLDEV